MHKVASTLSKRVIGAVLAAAVTMSFAAEASAGPMPVITGLGGLSAVSADATLMDVRYKPRRRYVRRGYRGGYGGGAAVLGIIGLGAAAAIAASQNRRYYDDGDYGYAPRQTYYPQVQPYYEPSYAAPVYQDPGYYPQQRIYRQPQVYNPPVYQQPPRVFQQPRQVYQQAPPQRVYRGPYPGQSLNQPGAVLPNYAPNPGRDPK